MSERDQDHWESLLGQLGAVPQQPPPRPAKKPSVEEQRRLAPPPRVRPPTTDWTDVAKDLGVVPADVLPVEALKRRVSDDFAPPPRAAEEPTFEAPLGAATEAELPSQRIEPSLSGEERAERAPSARPAAPSGFGAGILDLAPPEELVECPSPPAWLEEVEEETQERPRRRRRRRGRPRDAERASERPAAAEAPSAPEESEEFPPDAVAEPEAERPRRRRRRRSRRDEDRRDDGRPAHRERPQETVLETEGTAAVGAVGADENHEPLDDDEPRDEAEHRNIPSWDEAIGVIIAKNMEARQKNPNGYRSRGRPRGRG